MKNLNGLKELIDEFLEDARHEDIDANIMYLDNQLHKITSYINRECIKDGFDNSSKEILVNLYEQIIQLFTEFKAEHMNK